MNNPLRKPEHRGSGFSIRGLAQQIRDLIDWGRTLTDRVNYLSRLAGVGQVTVSWLPGGPVVNGGVATGKGPLLGKTDAAIAQGGFGTVSIWNGVPGSEADSGLNVTGHNRFADVDAAKFVWLSHNGYGWYLTAREC